jgi:hypothetical protein
MPDKANAKVIITNNKLKEPMFWSENTRTIKKIFTKINIPVACI